MEGNVNRECWPEATFCKLIYIFVDSLPTNLLSTSCWCVVFVDSRTGAKNCHLRWMLHRGAISGRDGMVRGIEHLFISSPVVVRQEMCEALSISVR